MSDILIAIIVVVVIGLLVCAAIIAHRRAKERREALAAWAASKGFHYRSDKDRELAQRYGCIDALSHGSNRYAYNIVEGEYTCSAGALKVTLFDYHYETHSTDSKGRRRTHHHYFSALLLETPFSFPSELKIRPEGLFDKLVSLVGFDDIDFESSEFSKAFHVKSKDRKFAYDIIHPRMMEFLLTQRDYQIELEQRLVCVTRANRRYALGEWEAWLTYGCAFLELMPEYLCQKLSAPAGE